MTKAAILAATILYAGSAFSAESLSNLTGAENVGNPSGAGSPSQVVILHNTPSQEQETAAVSYSDSRLKQHKDYSVRNGWGTGDSLDDLRSGRVRKEAQNEQALMEKLEESRMEDEKTRLRRLFKIREYNKRRHHELNDESYEFGDIDSDYDVDVNVYETSHAPRRPVKTVIIADTPKVEKYEAPEPADNKTTAKFNPHHGERKSYIKGQLGVGGYKASNSTMETSWGFAFGQDIDHRWYFELGGTKATYEIEDPRAAVINNGYNPYTNTLDISQARTLEQYNFTGLVGLKLINTYNMTGALRGGLSYVRRDSESSDISGFQTFRSNTIDGLIGANVDIKIANNLSAVGTFDYYTNVLNDISSTDSNTVERVETSDYFILGAGLKLTF